MTIISTTVGKNLLEEIYGWRFVTLCRSPPRKRNAIFGYSLKNDRMILVHFPGKPFNITIIQVCAPTTDAKEAEVKWFCEGLQDLLELTPTKDVLFFKVDWNAKMESQEIPGVTSKSGLGVQMKWGKD